MLSYMERVAYPPVYDEPETEKLEVLNVVFGRQCRDGLGRDYDDLMSDTPLILWAERIALSPEAERDLFAFLGQRWSDVPVSVKREIEALAESAAKE